MFHVLNRAVAREDIFWKPADYEAFEGVLQQAGRRVALVELVASRARERCGFSGSLAGPGGKGMVGRGRA